MLGVRIALNCGNAMCQIKGVGKALNSSIVHGRHIAAKQFTLRNLYGILTGTLNLRLCSV